MQSRFLKRSKHRLSIWYTYKQMAKMSTRTHYQVLSLPKTATQGEIKEAYIKLSKQTHPDLHPKDPSKHEEFVEINNAYAMLRNPLTRKDYDMSLPVPSMGPFSSHTHTQHPELWRASAHQHYQKHSQQQQQPPFDEHENFHRAGYYDKETGATRTKYRSSRVSVGVVLAIVAAYTGAMWYSIIKSWRLDNQNEGLTEEQFQRLFKYFKYGLAFVAFYNIALFFRALKVRTSQRFDPNVQMLLRTQAYEREQKREGRQVPRERPNKKPRKKDDNIVMETPSTVVLQPSTSDTVSVKVT